MDPQYLMACVTALLLGFGLAWLMDMLGVLP
jgi:hypothetical protein